MKHKLITKAPFHGMIVITWNLDKKADASFMSNTDKKHTIQILRRAVRRISNAK